ncbi:WD40 repeat-like protein [Suillus weaverae]|nr:WD40 repeat-like protein [Suillus weaverae]
MSSQTNQKPETPAVMPRQTMKGHTDDVKGVVHLPDGRRIVTCSLDGSLRLWDLDGGGQIDEDWRDDKEKKAGVFKMALSPNGKTVVSGGYNGKVKLWDVETGKVVVRWTGNTSEVVWSVCWSGDGIRVGSGFSDGTTRVFDVKTGETILEIKTGHECVWAVIYSPDQTKIATGGYNKYGVKIWDANTGELLATLEHDSNIVWSLAWGEKLISSSYGSIRIFDTATWQEIAILRGHESVVYAITLSRNERLLASASWDNTVRLWNLDTNLPVGPPLQHKDVMECAAFSADQKMLVTGCNDNNAYTWDIHAILKEAGLELPIGINIAPKSRLERTPRSSLSDKSFLEADATRCHDEFGDVDELSPRFFDAMEADDSSPTGGTHPHSFANPLLARLSTLLRQFRQLPTPSGLHPRVLLGRLFSLFHRSPPENNEANEPQQLSTPSGLDLHALFAHLSSLLPRSRLDSGTEPRSTTHLSSPPDASIDIMSWFFRSRPRTSNEIELSQHTMHAHVVQVPAMRDREVLFVAPRPPPNRQHTQPNGATTPGARPAHSLPLRMLAHLVLFLCCASPPHADGNAYSTEQQQQQGPSQGPVQIQTPSPQTQPAAPPASTFAVPIAPDTRTTLTRAATA